MRILALDTATAATATALVDTVNGRELEAHDDPPAGSRPSHASVLLTLVEAVLERSGDGWPAIDRIAVGLGPGTFTGLRIGVATAQGLARARGTPLVGVSTLQSLALGASSAAEPGQTVLAVIDARRGEAFAAAYRAAVAPDRDGGAGERGAGIADITHLAPAVLTPEALAAEVTRLTAHAGRVLAVGDGAIKFRASLEAAGAAVPGSASDLHRVSALWHGRLAETAERQPLSAIQPHYLRVPDAELNR
jgi:tRNA threonylcarbamoyladenosine biosynthesis protein TsaB